MQIRNISIPSRLLGAIAAVSLSCTAMADVTIDDQGNGFVGKGDVQAVFDWNNAQLQENAGSVVFRLGTSSVAAWQCQNPGKGTVNIHDYTADVDTAVASDTRKNKVGQVTGFILSGFTTGSTVAIGGCPNANWTFVEGSLTYLQGGEQTSSLQVSINGSDWFDLE